MPFSFGLAIFLALVALGGFIYWRSLRKKINHEQVKQDALKQARENGESHSLYDNASSPRLTLRQRNARFVLIGIISALVLAIGLTTFASANIVDTKKVGVITSFGRPIDTHSNGLAWVKPWEMVTQMDAAVQTDNHLKVGDKEDCIKVRIAHQTIGCADTTAVWRIKEPSADSLFQDYKDAEKVRDTLVTRELNAAMNEVFATYDPMAVDEKGNSTTGSTMALSTQVLEKLRVKIGDKIEVISVMAPVMHYDANTQNRINAFQAQIAQTRIAEQAKLTAIAQAAANREIAASVSNNPSVLESRCIDLLNEMVDKNQQIPIGFSCFHGGSSALLVPQASAK